MIKLTYTTLLLSFIFFVSACKPGEDNSNKPLKNNIPSSSRDSLVVVPGNSNLHEDIELTSVTRQTMPVRVKCGGRIKARPGDIMSITPPHKGFIRRLNIQAGDPVKKGAILATLSHPDYLKLQQNYLSALGHYEYYRREYKRQGELAVDQAAPLSKVQKAKAYFDDYQSQVQSLEKQLGMLNIDPTQIKSGEPVTEIHLKAPISGFVSSIGVHPGQLANEEMVICKIVNMDHPRVVLDLAEQYAGGMEPGKKFSFTLAGDRKRYEGEVKNTSQIIDPKTNTFKVYASILNAGRSFKHGRQVEASLIMGQDSVWAVPHGSLVDNQEGSFVFVLSGKGYQPVHIKTGNRQEGYVQIINPEALTNKKFAANAQVLLNYQDNQYP